MLSATPDILEIAAPETVILDGTDVSGPRPEFLVQESDDVSALRLLARHRRRPWQALFSPTAGKVSRINRGPRRSLASVEILTDPNKAATSPIGETPTRGDLVTCGLWNLVRSRPFSTVADPDANPRTVLVTAFFDDPLGPDPADMLDERDRRALARGLSVLAALASCGATLCYFGRDPTGGITIPGLSRCRLSRRSPRNLGALVRRFGPASPETPVWYLDWQGAAEFGRRTTDETTAVRRLCTIRLPDGGLRVIRAVVGTPISHLRDALDIQGGIFVHGNPSLLQEHTATGWTTDRLSVLRAYPRTRPAKALRPVMPLPALDAALSQMPAPVLFLRALAMGDDETAVKLGAFDLGPEDVALCTHLCVSGNDYAALLARMSERLAEDWNSR